MSDKMREDHLTDPADLWDAYCAETPAKRRSPQGAMAFAFGKLTAPSRPENEGPWFKRSGLEYLYVKRFRTLIMVGPSIRDEVKALLDAPTLPPQDGDPVRLGDAVYVNDLSPYAHDWRNADWLKVVSLRIDPEGKKWASITEGNQRHRGNGVYDGETDGFDADHLSPLPRAERGTGS